MDDIARAICPICGSTSTVHFANARDVEYYSTDQTYRYDQCHDCGGVFLNSPPVDQLGVIYPENYYSYAAQTKPKSILRRVKQYLDRRLFNEVLAQIDAEQVAALDIGGGDGWLLSELQSASNRVAETHVIDMDPKACGSARSRGHVYHCCRIEDFATDRRFDLILMLNLIEHVADPGSVLRRVRDLLTNNGRVLIKTPNIRTLDQRLFRHHNWGGFHCPRHFVLFSHDNFVRLSQECGLEVTGFKYTQGAPQWAASILGVLARHRIIRIDRARPMHQHPLNAPITAAAAAFDFLRLAFAPTAQMLFTLRKGAAAGS